MKRLLLPRLLRAANFRFAAFYTAVFVGSACLLGLAVFAEARSALRQQLDSRIQAEAGFLLTEYRQEGLSHLLSLVQTRGRGATALDYLVQNGKTDHLQGEMPAQPGLAPGWTTIDVPQASEDGGKPERVRALVSSLGGGMLLAVGGDLRQIDELEEAIITAFAGTAALVAGLGIVGGVLLSQAFLRRVDAISRTAEAIIEGDLSRRVPLRGTGDDLDRMAGTLNHMLDRITALMESLRQVSSDVAHDLRTPLTRLFQRLETSRTQTRSVAEYQATIEGAIADTQGLLDTFSALLRIAEVEGAAPRLRFTGLDLAVLAETVADAYRLDAEASGQTLLIASGGAARIEGDKELLMQALANLVENALRHTPPGTQTTIRITPDPVAGHVLAVEDDGPGVSAADIPRLTHRFFRGEHSRSTPGNGLGLSLVAAVADLHRAQLDIVTTAPGLRVALCFRAVVAEAMPCRRSSRGPEIPLPTPPAHAGPT